MDQLTELSRSLGEALKACRQSVAVCESSAGGLISASLTAVPGASAFFLGGMVIYTLEARREILNIADGDMKGIRGATEAYAMLCARTIQARMGSVWAVAETGASGPDGNPYGDPPGHACLAITGPVERVITVETGQSDREDNMWAFTSAALTLLQDCLNQNSSD